MRPDTLKAKAARGMAWTAFEQIAMQVVRFAVGIAIARFLMPADYGIVPMLALVYAICETFIDSGMGAALVRKETRTELDYATLFYFNLGAAVFFYVCLFSAAPWIARFFGMPVLVPVTRVTALNLVIGAFGTVQRTRLNIALDFKPMTAVDLSMSVLSGLAGIVMASRGFGVWALVWPGLVTSAIGTALIWHITRWRPRLAFSRASFRDLFGFGSKILCSSLINTVYGKVSTLVIGKFHSPAELGLFGRGRQFPDCPMGFVQGMVLRVTYPLLSKVNSEAPERLAEIYRRVLLLPVCVLAPVLAGLACVAHPLVDALLGEKWLGCVVFCRIACFECLWGPLSHINLNLLYVKGRSDLVLRLELIKKPIAFALLIASFRFGVIGIVTSLAAYEFIAYSFNCYYTGRLIGLGEFRQLRLFLPVFLNVAVMSAAVLFAMSLVGASSAKLLVGIPTGALVYLALSWVGKDETLLEALNLIRRGVLSRPGGGKPA